MRIKTSPSCAARRPYRTVATAMLAVGLSLAANAAYAGAEFVEHNLVTDGTTVGSPTADHTDTRLINPWGVSYGPGGPFWVSDNTPGSRPSMTVLA